MFLYRALNEKDSSNYQTQQNLAAVRPLEEKDTKLCVRYISRHIKDGSNPECSECWISTTKDFQICAEEYSVPQSGRYNTSKKRKKIAVIKYDDYGSSDNVTYIKGNSSDPVRVKDNITFVKWEEYWDSIPFIKEFTLDLSYKNTRKKIPFQEYAYAHWIKEGFIKKLDGTNNKGVPGIPSGNAFKHKEVLILNEIPFKKIYRVLDLLHIDIIYGISHKEPEKIEEYIQNLPEKFADLESSYQPEQISALNRLLKESPQKFIVDVLKNIEYADFDILLYRYLYCEEKNLHEVATKIFNSCEYESKNGYDLIRIYSYLKKYKKRIISKILKKELHYTIPPSDIKLVDDKVFIAIYDETIPAGSIPKNALHSFRPAKEEDKYDIIFIVDRKGNSIDFEETHCLDSILNSGVLFL